MNYLAHFYLAERTEASILGAILGDFVKGQLHDRYTEEIRHGIRLHRLVDAYSDLHRLHTASRNLFSGKLRRYAGIIIDVTYDHFLAKNWANYSDMELENFATLTYGVLDKNMAILPESLQLMTPHLIAGDWLSGYAEEVGLEQTLLGLGRRIKRVNPMSEAFAEVQRNYDRIEQHFEEFFPELLAYAESKHQGTKAVIPAWKLALPAP